MCFVGQAVLGSELAALCGSNCVIHSCSRSQNFDECLGSTPASGWIGSPIRRAVDVLFAGIVLLVLAAPMLLLAACIRIGSSGGIFYRQQRVGRRGRLFKIYKFRSMIQSPHNTAAPGLTRAGDSRITVLGRFMRRFKIDELPQFYNVLRGDMSLIGPRPKLPKYCAMVNMAYRPGITGAAAVAFRHEEELMRGIHQDELDSFYAQNLMPVKDRLDVCYMCKATPASDLRLVTSTLLSCLRPAFAARSAAAVGHALSSLHLSAKSSAMSHPAVQPLSAYGIPAEEGAAATDL